ncbi:MAG TPA: ArsB/NhaD family transporter [Candidatus Heimdallarchaeota archaeon]|nr:ArsB/NhaD family transporter [Candidatus Heimdallarchaeota archaeon]
MGNPPSLPLAISLLVFACTYVGILLEKIHRTIIALLGAVAMIAVGTWFSFYEVDQAIGSIDFNTISLLLGMMIVVGLFKETGFFQYLAIKAAKLAGGKPWLLLVYLGLVTSLLSMVLDNVTTIIIVVPVTVSLTDILGVPVTPFLMSEVVLSNIGGVATLIGDPPNILIGSAAGFSFTDFLTHLAPIVVLAWLLAQGLLLFIFRGSLAQKPANVDHLMAMDARRSIADPLTANRMLKVLGFTILLFLVHDRIGLDPGLVALFGGCLGLLWVRPKLENILSDVHWDVLLFFIALFIIVGGLEGGGVLRLAGQGITLLSQRGMALAGLVVLWAGALGSGVISNVPFTIAMLPIFKGLASQGIPVVPLWWALALGVGLGGNLTPIGAAANVLVTSISDRTGEPLTYKRWFSSGSVVAVATCALASLALLLAIELRLF